MISIPSALQGMDQLSPQSHPDYASPLNLEIDSNFVISRYSNGDVLSRYGDNVWDLSPYSAVSSTEKPKINFCKFSFVQIENTKKIVFALLYHSQGGRKNVLSANYVFSMVQALKPISEFADNNNVFVIDVLCNVSLFKRFLRLENTRSTIEKINGIISNLIGNSDSYDFFKGLRFQHLEMIRHCLLQYPDTDQTPVIPQSILSNLMDELDKLFLDVERHFPRLIALLTRMTNDIYYGRARSTQIIKGCSTEELRPIFIEAVRDHRLLKFFKQNDLKNIKDLTRFLRRLLHASQVQIAIFSGMRIGEILALNVGCLRIENNRAGKTFIIDGYTSKYSGGKVKAQWVTDKRVSFPIKLCERLSLLGSSVLGLKLDQVPLFLSPSYAITSIKRPRYFEEIRKAKNSKLSRGAYGLLDISKFKIHKHDLEELKSIEPFRDWHADERFRVGEIWPFAFHQCRRSLAFYAVQKGLVSLPSLRSQLKHLTRSITVFYGQSRGVANVSTRTRHFKEFMQKIKPEADLICYINELLNSKEQLYGIGGKHLEKQKLKTDHHNLESRFKVLTDFKKGNLSYSETPIGACLSLSKCESKSVGNLTACISCKDAVIKPSLLIKAISRQEVLLERCQRNNLDDYKYRYETRELDLLKGFRKNMEKGKIDEVD